MSEVDGSEMTSIEIRVRGLGNIFHAMIMEDADKIVERTSKAIQKALMEFDYEKVVEAEAKAVLREFWREHLNEINPRGRGRAAVRDAVLAICGRIREAIVKQNEP